MSEILNNNNDYEDYSYFTNTLSKFDFDMINYNYMKFKNIFSVEISLIGLSLRMYDDSDTSDDYKFVYALYNKLSRQDLSASSNFNRIIYNYKDVIKITDQFLLYFLYGGTIGINAIELQKIYSTYEIGHREFVMYEQVVEFWDNFYKKLDLDSQDPDVIKYLKVFTNLNLKYFPSRIMPNEDLKILKYLL